VEDLRWNGEAIFPSNPLIQNLFGIEKSPLSLRKGFLDMSSSPGR
jgi:hypothetical protein